MYKSQPLHTSMLPLITPLFVITAEFTTFKLSTTTESAITVLLKTI